MIKPSKDFAKKLNSRQNLSTGFPNPADDFRSKQIDLNEKLIQNPAATFFVRVKADRDKRLKDRIAIVDRSLEPNSGDLIIIQNNGELKLAHYSKELRGKLLQMNEKTEVEGSSVIWGVVIHMIGSYR
jgi:DNA polymerase V